MLTLVKVPVRCNVRRIEQQSRIHALGRCTLIEATISETPVYERNLDAFSVRQPELVERLHTASIPQGVREATGRDGSKTFRIQTINGSEVWLGGSSMPTISAPAIIRDSALLGGNVILPSMLTGDEPLQLLETAPTHVAVFVVERCLLNLKLALHRRDFASHIRNGRLVLFTSDDLIPETVNFFERFPGYEFPRHMVSIPHLLPAKLADFQREVQAAGSMVSERQSQNVQQLAKYLKSTPISKGGSPSLAILSICSTPFFIDQARRIEQSAQSLGWRVTSCLPTDPTNCHTIARLRILKNAQPRAVLLIGYEPQRMRQFLQDELPCITWYLPGMSLKGLSATGLDPQDYALVCAASPLFDCHTTSPRILQAGPAVLASSIRDEAHASEHSFKRDITLVADLPPEDPSAAGITLPTQLALWRTIVSLIPSEPDQQQPLLPDRLLAEAETRSGIVLREETIRAEFLDLIATAILPRRWALAVSNTLMGMGYSLASLGLHWPNAKTGSLSMLGDIPVGETICETLLGSRIVLFPVFSEVYLQQALDTLASGVAVVVRAPQHAFVDLYPDLADIAPHLNLFEGVSELLAGVDRAHRSSSGPQPVGEAQQLLKKKHTVAHRLEMMAKHIGLLEARTS